MYGPTTSAATSTHRRRPAPPDGASAVAPDRRPRALAAALRVALVAALLPTITGCGGESPPEGVPRPVVESQATGVKILLVGIDGATFSVLDPLVAAGELPHLEGLLRRGARGVLASDRPMRSPALWTSVATGRDREDHGVIHFTERDEAGEAVLANSTMRRRLTLWDMLGAAGRDVGVVGWWATWPAEPVRGWLVSDRMTHSRWSLWADGVKQEGLTYPPELAEELLPLVVDPLDPPLDTIRGIIDLTPAEERELLSAQRPLRAHGPSVLKFSLCTQLTYERIAERLLTERGQPDFSSIFLIANDAVSHTFWHYLQPERFEGVDPAEAERLGAVIGNLSRHNDAYLGRLQELIDESTVTVVISDHGFKASGKLPAERNWERVRGAFTEEFADERDPDAAVTVGQSGIHHPDGILVAAGWPIVPGGEAVGATLFDLAPTLLALMGLPVPEDLPGRVLTEIIEPAFLERHPVRRIPSYERLIDRDALLAATAIDNDESTLEMLRSLGYIQ